MKVCPNCRSSNDNNAKFCENCGIALLYQSFQTSYTPTVANSAFLQTNVSQQTDPNYMLRYAPPKKKPKFVANIKDRGFFITGFVVAILMSIVIILYGIISDDIDVSYVIPVPLLFWAPPILQIVIANYYKNHIKRLLFMLSQYGLFWFAIPLMFLTEMNDGNEIIKWIAVSIGIAIFIMWFLAAFWPKD